jgi:hypothetical protein
MDKLNNLLNGPAIVTSDQVSGRILDSTPLLETDVWQDAVDHFDGFAEAEANAGLALEQQQYLVDLRIDRFLHDRLASECGFLAVWLQNNPGSPEAGQVASLMRLRDQFGARARIDQQEKFYLWATRNNQDNLAGSILGWRLLCQELAGFAGILSSESPEDMGGPVF